MDLPILIAQAASKPPGAAAGPFEVLVVGFLFVIFVLALLASVTSGLGMLFARGAKAEAAKARKAAEAAGEKDFPAAESPDAGATAEAAAPAGDPAFLAVVAAAVHTVYGDRPHRLVSVRSAGSGWAQEGRRQIFSSHRVR